MAVETIYPNTKRCATCAYWCGSRTERNGIVYVENLRDPRNVAMCCNRNANNYTHGREVPANYCCGTCWRPMD